MVIKAIAKQKQIPEQKKLISLKGIAKLLVSEEELDKTIEDTKTHNF